MRRQEFNILRQKRSSGTDKWENNLSRIRTVTWNLGWSSNSTRSPRRPIVMLVDHNIIIW